MRTRSLLPALVLALMVGGAFLPAQEMPQHQIVNWPAPALWQPLADATSRTRGIIGTEGILASSSSPFPFIAVTPCRIIDTRLSGGAFGVGETRTYAMSGGALPCVGGLPPGIAAVSLNITVTQTAGTGFVTGFPTGGSLPVVSSVNWVGGNQSVSNAAVVPTGTSSSINIYASQATHVILDVNGYYAGAAIGNSNTFVGLNAGNSTMAGDNNTGVGREALVSNTAGSDNTAMGFEALAFNTIGINNTAVGSNALLNNTNTDLNTAIGANTLVLNTGGSSNTAVGANALFGNTTGVGNTAIGGGALTKNISGADNLAIGLGALGNNTTGDSNIAIGFTAGSALTTGSKNVCIAHSGVPGESGAIRIGNNLDQTATFISGIRGVSITGGVAVFVDGNGQLGTTTSSRRFKKDIRDIAEESDGLMRLRPVAFRYKRELDPTGLAQYGLIAEEVAEVYPDLVASDREGRPETVRYHLIEPLLLNEVQRQHRTVEAQERKIEQQSRSIESQQAEIERLKADLSALRALISRN